MSKAIEGAALLVSAGVGLAILTGGLSFAGIMALTNTEMSVLGGMVVAGIGMEAAALSTALTANRGMGISTRQVAGPQQIIYGEQRVGGTIIYESTTGSNHDQYNYVIVIAGHVVDSIVNLYLDGRQVYWQGSGAGYSVRNGVGFGGIADSANHEGPDGQQYNFGGTGHSGIYCEARYGDQSDGDVIGALTANDGNWAAVSGGSPWVGGCCYVYLKIEYNQTVFPNPPEVRFTVRGKNNIWDPRTGTTGYSSNSALCVADVILDTEFGLGDVEAFQDSGSLAALVAAANVCDELVSVAATSSSEARYCCHYHYDAATPPGDAMQVMLQTMGGRISQPGGEWYITPAYWQGSSFTFDSNSLRGEVSWEPNRSQKDLFNRVNGTYIAANWPWNTATAPGSLSNLYDSNGFYNGMTANTFPFAFQPSSFPQYAADPLHGYAADQYLDQDSRVLGAWASGTTYNLGDTVTYSGAIYRSLVASNVGNTPSTATTDWVPYQNLLPMELTLRGVLSVTQAQRLAKIALLRNRAQGSGTFPMALAARQMQVCDVMQFTWPALGWSGKTLEVVRAKWSTSYDGEAPKETTELQLIETNSAIYAWSTAEELTVYDVPATPQQQYRQPNAPTGMSLATEYLTSATGDVVPRIEVLWTSPADVLTTYVVIRYALVTSGTPGPWISAGTADVSLTSFYIDGVVSGLVYDVQIAGVRGSSGAQSAWVEIDGFTVGGVAVATQLALAPGTLVAQAVPAFSFTGDVSTPLNLIAHVSAVAVAQGIVAGVTPVSGPGVPSGTIVSSIYAPPHAIGTAPTYHLTLSNYMTGSGGTGLTFGAGVSALIEGGTFTDVIGNTTVTVSPSNYPLQVPNQGALYFVYYIDHALAGGAVTAVATQNQADYLNKSGYFFIDSIVTPVLGLGGSPTGTRYYPTGYLDSGGRTTANPASVYYVGGSNAIVSGSIFYDGFGNPCVTSDGLCTWTFPDVTLSYAATLTIIAQVDLDAAIGVTCKATATLGSGTLLSTSSPAGMTTYTLSVPSGTNLNTIAVTASVPCSTNSYPLTGSSVLSENPDIQISALYIQ